MSFASQQANLAQFLPLLSLNFNRTGISDAQFNQKFLDCRSILDSWASGTSSSPPIDISILHTLQAHKAILLEAKFHCENRETYQPSGLPSAIPYLTFPILSWLKHKLPLWKILALFQGSSAKDLALLLENDPGLLMHDFDSFQFCCSSSSSLNCVDLGLLLEACTECKNESFRFPILKYDHSIWKMDSSNFSLLLKHSLSVKVLERHGELHGIRYLSLPNLLSGHHHSNEWTIDDFRNQDKMMPLNTLIKALEEIPSDSFPRIIHLGLRRILFDISQLPSNKLFLQALLGQNASILKIFFEKALSTYKSAEGIKIFPNSLLNSREFRLKLYESRDVMVPNCFPDVVEAASQGKTSGFNGRIVELFDYFSSLHGDLVMIECGGKDSHVSSELFCLLAYEDKEKTLQFLMQNITSFKGISNFIIPLVKSYRAANLNAELPFYLKMILDQIEKSTVSNSNFAYSNIRQFAVAMIHSFKADPANAEKMRQSIPSQLEIFYDIALESLSKIPRPQTPSFWAIPIGCLGLFGFFVLIAGVLSWFMQRWSFVFANQNPPKAVVVLEEEVGEQEFEIFLTAEQEQELRELGPEALEFHLENDSL